MKFFQTKQKMNCKLNDIPRDIPYKDERKLKSKRKNTQANVNNLLIQRILLSFK